MLLQKLEKDKEIIARNLDKKVYVGGRFLYNKNIDKQQK